MVIKLNIKNNFINYMLSKRIMFKFENLNLYPYDYRGPNRLLGTSCEYVFYVAEDCGKEFVGRITIRMGESRVLYYLGHIGYTISNKYRGNNYAYKACKGLVPFMKDIGFEELVITNDIDNIPSRKTCIKLNSKLESIVTVPKCYQKKFDMKDKKCRYVLYI